MTFFKYGNILGVELFGWEAMLLLLLLKDTFKLGHDGFKGELIVELINVFSS